VRDLGDQPNEPEKCDDKDNESEMSEDDNPTSPRQQLAWMARSETDSSETDNMTSHESDLESDKEYDDDDVPLEPTRGERMLQIAQEGEWVDRLVEESRQEHARMTQSGTDSPMTNDDTTSREYDSESDREDEDDNLTEQTRGERLLDMVKEAIKAEESGNNARTRAEAPRPTSSTPRTTRQGPTTTRHRPPAALPKNSPGSGGRGR